MSILLQESEALKILKAIVLSDLTFCSDSKFRRITYKAICTFGFQLFWHVFCCLFLTDKKFSSPTTYMESR